MSITGDADGPATKVGVALVDVLTSKDAVAGVLAALYEREQSGRGQHVEVDLLSSLLGSLANQASSFLATGVSPARQGNAHPSIAPYETLRCADGELVICCGNDRQFESLARVLGEPGLATDPRFRANADRVHHRADLVKALESFLSARDASTWIDLLTGVGVPAGVVGDIGTAFALAEVLGLNPRVPTETGSPDQVRHPVRYSRTPVQQYIRPPRLGEHNAAVRDRIAAETRQS